MIIGSTAIKHFYPDFPREPKDLDFVIFEDEKIPTLDKSLNLNNLKIEFLVNDVLLDYCLTKGIVIYCTPDILYTLKISHVFWDLENGSWDKHIWDIQWLKQKGCKFIPDLFYQLYDYWNIVHGKNKRSDLDMEADEFFDNAVNFPINHDYLHELLVNHPYFCGEPPTYKKILKDGAQVDVSEEKYNSLTELEKFNLVFEEVAVMSFERFNKLHYKKAFGRMLKKFIISHAPLWESIWIIQNHKELLTNTPFDYFTHLKQQNKFKINQ